MFILVFSWLELWYAFSGVLRVEGEFLFCYPNVSVRHHSPSSGNKQTRYNSSSVASRPVTLTVAASATSPKRWNNKKKKINTSSTWSTPKNAYHI